MLNSDRDKMLDWVEKHGLDAIKYHHQAADDLKRDSTTTLTLLLAGGGGAMAYAAKAFESDGATPYFVAIAAVCAWWFLLAAVLVQSALKIRDIPAISNEPENLYQRNFDLAKIREVELKNLQKRIDATAERNAKTANWLNGVRLAAIAAPIVAAISWQIASCL